MKSNLFALIRFLLQNVRAVKHAPLMMGLIILTGFISGGSNAVLLAMISHLLGSVAPTSIQFIVIFFAICIILPLTRFASEALLINLSSIATLELRMRLSRQILSAPLRRLEELGPHRLFATLTQDITIIGGTSPLAIRLSRTTGTRTASPAYPAPSRKIMKGAGRLAVYCEGTYS